MSDFYNIKKRRPRQKIVVAERIRDLTNYIRGYVDENGYSPTYREMAEALEIRSTSTVKLLVDVMLEEGLITRDRNKTRTLKLVEHDDNVGGDT